MGGLNPGMERLRKRRNEMLEEMREVYYFHVHRMRSGKNEPNWRGHRVVKFPSDMVMYAESFWENKPDWIVETGTAHGGSALFFADMLTITGGNGRVITIDVDPVATPAHPRVQYIKGSSVDPKIVDTVRSTVAGNVMVVLDSDHSTKHVAAEMAAYEKIVTPGQFMVVEDCWARTREKFWPAYAVDAFLASRSNFVLEPMENKYLFAITRGGWLKRTC